ncbi:unnamed protein product [Paramecium sonneborni]|uniref:Uncharacterized protein n=1 Tax=Paramecium sonneborni TaxID=65129 RepID=A0A8S1QME4_9CILI|nr:unnamed protein product [Paramecium sonneborni]
MLELNSMQDFLDENFRFFIEIFEIGYEFINPNKQKRNRYYRDQSEDDIAQVFCMRYLQESLMEEEDKKIKTWNYQTAQFCRTLRSIHPVSHLILKINNQGQEDVIEIIFVRILLKLIYLNYQKIF